MSERSRKRTGSQGSSRSPSPGELHFHTPGGAQSTPTHISHSRSSCAWAECQAGALAVHLRQCCTSLLGKKQASFPLQLLLLCSLKKHLLESHDLHSLTQNIPAALASTGAGKGPSTRAGKAICTTTQPTVHLQLDVASTEGKRTLFGLQCERRDTGRGRKRLGHSRSLLVSRCCQA